MNYYDEEEKELIEWCELEYDKFIKLDEENLTD